MALRSHTLDSRFAALDREVGALRPGLAGSTAAAIDRWRADVAALRFHLQPATDRPPLLGILGGTGTGKSTLVNRLLDAAVSATSFRRTFTAGAVAIAADPKNLPNGWLGVGHRIATAEDLPARGQLDALIVVAAPQPLASKVTLIDTPDLDGDTPEHHAQADRVFRWADALLFLVTPEKYQMTELLPYYRLALRYGLPSLFAMNKTEEAAVLDDYARQLKDRGFTGTLPLFAIPRDDAAYEPPPDAGLPALRAAVESIHLPDAEQRQRGLAVRSTDLLGRLADQVLAPLRQDRREAERLLDVLHAMETPEPGVDVNPLTHQLQRRLQQRSVLYLMGPGRMMERVRQVPGLLVRLPRTLWDVVIRGKSANLGVADPADAAGGKLPDFKATLADQFIVVQSRIDDALRSSPSGERWLAEQTAGYQAAKLDPADAGKIAEEEMAELRNWLEKRWNATPRDTMLIMRLLRHLPGGQKLVKWSEATPYLLAVIVATHHVFFGHIDLMVIGGFSLATWLTEKLSNEVTSHVRAANRNIAERFTAMAHQQIARVAEWLQTQSPPPAVLDGIERAAEGIQEMLQKDGD